MMHRSDIDDMTKAVLGRAYEWKIALPFRKAIESGLTNFWKDYAAHIYGIADVIESAMEHQFAISDDMARMILKNLESSIDSEYGLRWRDVADEVCDTMKEFDFEKMEYLGKPLTPAEFRNLRGYFMLTHMPYGKVEYIYHLQDEGILLGDVINKAIAMREKNPQDLFRIHILQRPYFQEDSENMENDLFSYGTFLCYIAPDIYPSAIQFKARACTLSEYFNH